MQQGFPQSSIEPGWAPHSTSSIHVHYPSLLCDVLFPDRGQEGGGGGTKRVLCKALRTMECSCYIFRKTEYDIFLMCFRSCLLVFLLCFIFCRALYEGSQNLECASPRALQVVKKKHCCGTQGDM